MAGQVQHNKVTGSSTSPIIIVLLTAIVFGFAVVMAVLTK